MKVILRQKVKGLGVEGDVKEVSDGYARNYLLPRGLAVVADAGNMEDLKRKKAAERQRQAKEQAHNEQLKAEIESRPLQITANAGEGGRLFGSITSKDIADHLARKGIKVDRRKIILPEPLRQLGEHKIIIRLQPQVEAELKLTIVTE